MDALDKVSQLTILCANLCAFELLFSCNQLFLCNCACYCPFLSKATPSVLEHYKQWLFGFLNHPSQLKPGHEQNLDIIEHLIVK